MRQSSDVRFRAEKEYKHSREAFAMLLREVISNSIHAVLIRKSKENIEAHYKPELKLNINLNDEECRITLRDNGEGFTDENRKNFVELDRINKEKENFGFHPLGQGRLAIVYCTDHAEYETVYKDNDGTLKHKIIQYPNEELGLFDIDNSGESPLSEKNDTYSELRIVISKSSNMKRANTFFSKFLDATALKQWVIETFFPFVAANDDLLIAISFNGDSVIVDRNSIESEVKSIDFSTQLQNEQCDFKLWLIKKGFPKLQGDNPIDCFARNLKAKLATGKLYYTIDSNDGYLFYLTSHFFDEHVDTKGEIIEIEDEEVSIINDEITRILDKEFDAIIKQNQKETKRHFEKFKKRYPSLELFVQKEDVANGKIVVDENDL